MRPIDRRTFLARSGALGGAILLGGGFVLGAEERGAIRVGATLPLGGPPFFADDGLHQLLGYRLWVEDVNRAGGLLGRPVKLTVYDDRNDPGLAAQLFRRLIRDDGVDLLLGNYGSGLARATIPVVEAARVPCVFPMAWQDALWNSPHRYAAPLLPPASVVCRPLAVYLERQGVARAAAIWADNDYARDLAFSLRRWLADQGITISYQAEYGKARPLEAVLAEAADTHPDVLAGGNIGDAIPDITTALGNEGLTFPASAYFELDEPVLLQHRDALEGAIGFGLWLPTMPFPDNQRFVRDFAWRWEPEYPDRGVGLLLDHHSAAGYAAGQVTERALRQAGSLDREAVRAALFTLDTATVFGPYRLDANGIQVGKQVPVVGYSNGLRTPLWLPSMGS
ncbi:MAG TPA: amino acid ABC transporter substrate-binding protein [Trueperaceae bacterium]|nr:amino acid ABC transporter substrate-binding protein [Trueperaceae bacterium]